MKAFEHVSPKTLADATSFLTDDREDAVVMAGGTDLLTEMKDRIAQPGRVVDLKSIDGLDEIAWTDGEEGDRSVSIGALVTLGALADDPKLVGPYAAISAAAAAAATPQIRNQGTIGGNLCQRPRCPYYRDPELFCHKRGGLICYAEKGDNRYHALFGGGPSYIAHPSDLAPALIALGAEVEIQSGGEVKKMPLEDFFILPSEDPTRETVLQPNEILLRISVPPLSRYGSAPTSAFLKATQRGSWDFALVSAAVFLAFEATGECKGGRIVLGGVAPKPWSVPEAGKFLMGKSIDEKVASAAADAAFEGAKPMSGNGYKVPLGKAVVKRAILQAAQVA